MAVVPPEIPQMDRHTCGWGWADKKILPAESIINKTNLQSQTSENTLLYRAFMN